MIIPVRCMTCGEVLADKYLFYKREVRRLKSQLVADGSMQAVTYFKPGQQTEKTHEGKVLDQLHLTKMCCRRHMLTHVDIE